MKKGLVIILAELFICSNSIGFAAPPSFTGSTIIANSDHIFTAPDKIAVANCHT